MAPRPRRWQQEEVEGPEKALDWRPGWHQRPNHRPEARFGEPAAQIGARPLTSPAGGHACILLPQRAVTHSPGGLMLHYRKDIEALIGIIGCQDHRVKAMELEQNLTTGIEGNKGS